MQLELHNVTLRGDGEVKLKAYLKRELQNLKSELRPIFEDRLVKWRKIYEAEPAEKVRTFPFEGCSNLVVPIAAIHVDTLLARLLAATWKYKPIWVLKVMGNFKGTAEPLREALQDYLSEVAMEPNELALYEISKYGYNQTIKYGTNVWKFLWETQVRDFFSPDGGKGGYDRKTIYDGPKAINLEFDDFWIRPSAKNIRSAKLKVHRKRMFRDDLEEARFWQRYPPEKIKAILGSPDRRSPRIVEASANQAAGIQTSSFDGYEEWDIFECWHDYQLGDKIVKLVSTYHLGTDTLLRCVYDPYDYDIFVASRLFERDGQFHGYGFCERLATFQEEVSKCHNQRRDASTIGMTKAFRVSPDSKLHQGYKFFPMATLPGEKDEIEGISLGEPGQLSIEDERLTLELAERLTGISPPMQGYGTGTVSKSTGAYSAMGTLSLLQEGNNRTDLSVMDIRVAHSLMGRIVARMNADFGLQEDRFIGYGDTAPLIMDALRQLKSGTISIPVTAPTASVNREVEKQSDIMLVNLMSKHYGQITQMLMQAQALQSTPGVAEYLGKAIISANYMMKTILKHFDRDDPDKYIPGVGNENPSGAAPETNQISGPEGARGGLSLVPNGVPRPGPGGAVPTPRPGGNLQIPGGGGSIQ